MAVGTLAVFFALGGSGAGAATSVGESSVTAPPVDRRPVSASQATLPPVTVPPVTVPPVTVPPVTVPPVTVPVVTAPPVTAPPVTAPPVTLPAASQATVPSTSTPPASTSIEAPPETLPGGGSGSAVRGAPGESSSTETRADLPARLARGAVETARQLGLPIALSMAIVLFLVIEPFSGKRDPRLVSREITDDDQLGFS